MEEQISMGEETGMWDDVKVTENLERSRNEKEDSKPELKSSGNKTVTRKGGQEKTVQLCHEFLRQWKLWRRQKIGRYLYRLLALFLTEGRLQRTWKDLLNNILIKICHIDILAQVHKDMYTRIFTKTSFVMVRKKKTTQKQDKYFSMENWLPRLWYITVHSS